MKSTIDTSNKDWNKFIEEVNFTAKDVEYYLNHVLDTPEFNITAGEVVDIENDTYIKGKSCIHGYGIFAKKDINKGDIIGIAVGYSNNKKYRSYIGRFVNHSNVKNAKLKELDSKEVIAICTLNIGSGEEILVDYRDHWFKL